MRLIDGEISDVGGIRKRPIRFGKRLTIVTGENGSGKSTIARSIVATLEGGEDLARFANVQAGEDAEPAVVLRAEAEGRPLEFVRVPKRVTAKRAVLDEAGRPTAALEALPNAAAWMKAMLPRVAINVVELLSAKGKALATLILQACPLKMNRVELVGAIGLDPANLKRAIPAGLHPLVECDLIRDAIFDTRTDVNRDLKAKRETVEQLLRTIPKDIPADLAREIEQADARRLEFERQAAALATKASTERRAAGEAAAAAANAAGDKVEAELKRESEAASAAHEKWAAQQRAELERRIAAAAVGVAASVEGLRTAAKARLAEIDAEEVLAVDAAEAAYGSAIASLKRVNEDARDAAARVAELRAQDQRAAIDRHTRAQAEDQTAQADDLAETAQQLTNALDALEQFRRRMATSIPIKGLAITSEDDDEPGKKGGKVRELNKVTVDGVPWEQLNEAQRVSLLVRLVVMGAEGAKLPLIVVDQAEKLVGANWVALLRELASSPIQALVCRAEPHPLEVVPVDELADLDAYLERAEAVA